MHLVLYCKNLISALNDSWNDKGVIRELQQDLLVICNNSTRSDHNKGMNFIFNTMTQAEVQSWSQVLTGATLKQGIWFLSDCSTSIAALCCSSLPFLLLYLPPQQNIERGKRYIPLFLFLPRGRGTSFLCY